MPNNLPDVLHIGFSKAASTWLQSLFRQDDDIYFVYKTHYFFPLDSEIYEKGKNHYESFFKNSHDNQILLESQEHIILPKIHPELECACTNLEAVETVANRIKKTLPNVKIILVIRNQEQMILSRYIQYVVQGGWLKPDEFFDKLIFDENNFKLFADYRYYEIIKRLNEVFGQNKVLVLLQEDLFQNQNITIEKISSFIGHSLSFPRKQKKRNVGASYAATNLIRFLNQIWVKQVETIHSKTDTLGPHFAWLYSKELIRKVDGLLNTKKKKHLYLSSGRREKLKDIFSSDNRKLEKYLDRSIKELGYYYE